MVRVTLISANRGRLPAVVSNVRQTPRFARPVVRRPTVVLCLVVSVTTLACAGVAAAAAPPWAVLARGGGPAAVPGGGVAGAALITRRSQLNNYPYVTMHPGRGGCCDWYDKFDWTRRVVILTVAKVPYEFEVTAVRRRGNVLRVTIAHRYPQQPDFASPVTTWEAIGISRVLVGRPLPTRIIVHVP